jgi:hypothetical protein
MSDFLSEVAAKDHAIVAPIVRELHEPEGKTFITDNLQRPAGSYIATFRIGVRSFTAWTKPGTDSPCKFVDLKNNTVLRVTRSYLVFIERIA